MVSIDLRSFLVQERLRRSKVDCSVSCSSDAGVAELRSSTAPHDVGPQLYDMVPVGSEVVQVPTFLVSRLICTLRMHSGSCHDSSFLCNESSCCCQEHDQRSRSAWLYQGVSYIPNFINSAEEADLLRHVDAAPASRWVACGDGRRRTQNWGGRPGSRVVTEVRLQQLLNRAL